MAYQKTVGVTGGPKPGSLQVATFPSVSSASRGHLPPAGSCPFVECLPTQVMPEAACGFLDTGHFGHN